MSRGQKWHRWSTCQPWKIIKMTSMNHETTRKSQIEQVIFRRSALEAENASPLVPDEQHMFRPWGDEIREIEKNDEFAHVKMPPLSILNEKTALELTTLFLERFPSTEAQNGPFGTDVRFPLVKLTFVSLQNWIFNGIWTPMGRGNHGPGQPPTPGNLSFALGKVSFWWVQRAHRRLLWVILR